MIKWKLTRVLALLAVLAAIAAVGAGLRWGLMVAPAESEAASHYGTLGLRW